MNNQAVGIFIPDTEKASTFLSLRLQKIINDDGHELTQCSPLGIGNLLKLSFGFPAHSHTYGIGTILHRGRLQ